MTSNCIKFLCSLLFIGAISTGLNAQSILLVQQGQPTSIRGLSVVDDSIAWISGSKGHIAITHNGGKSWDWQQVKGFEKADFRDIEAFSDKEAIIMSSGTPALILKTIDGGANWQVKYRNTDTAYFLDAMDFDNPKHGVILGDPINNKFTLLETDDSGETWHMFRTLPDALPGEAAFAASGTCLRADGKFLYIASGGTSARLITYSVHNCSWSYANLPVTHGKASQGAFSFATNINTGVIVGGDYSNDKKKDSIAAIYAVHPFTLLKMSTKQPAGFQSCVEFVTSDTFLATGTPGSNITTDGGKIWSQIDTISYNVCRRAKKGKLVLLAGDKGKIGIFKP